MSYVKCRSITINEKNNIIKISGADNNVYPITYYTYNVMEKSNKTFKEELIEILREISGGSLQLNNSMYKWNYAIYKTNEELNYNWSTLYYESCNKDPIYYIGKKPYVFEERDLFEIQKSDITDDYELIMEYGDNAEYYSKEKRKIDNKRISDVNDRYFNTFMKYFNDKNDGIKYYLHSDVYGYYVKPTKYGFSYSYYESNKKVGTYKEMFCKLKDIYNNDKYGFTIKRIDV